MSVALKLKNNVLTILIKGEIDHHTAPAIRESIDDAIAVNCNANLVILDFSGVSFMDSTGIGMLLGRYNKFTKNDISIFIKNPTSYVNRIFEMTGIYQIIPKVC